MIGSGVESGALPGDGSGRLSLALNLARRELRGGFKGFRIFLACLVLGVAAIAGVGSVSESVLTGLRQEGRVLLGGDLDLRLVHRRASAEQRAWLAGRGAVSEVVALRAMAHAPGPAGRRALIELRAVDSLYPLYGAVGLDPAGPLDQALAYRNGAWGAIVDAALLSRLADDAVPLAPGARIRVGEAIYEIRARLTREPDRASSLLSFGPHVLVALGSLEDTGLVRPGSMTHSHIRLRLPPDRPMAEVRAALGETFPEAGWRVRDARQAAPGVQLFIERVGLFLTLVGLTALLVGGLGVGNAVRSHLDGRMATIATLKCLGASGQLIFRIYLAQILFLALVGVIVGLGLGAAAPSLGGAVLCQGVGWRPVGGLFPLPLLNAAAFGILTAVTFSLWPLARARAIPAAALFRDRVAPGPAKWPGLGSLGAIGLGALGLAALVVATAAERRFGVYFVVGAIGALIVFRLAAAGIIALAERAPRPRHPGLRLALANLHRPDAPTASVVVSLGLGLTVLVAVALIQGNLSRQFDETLPEEAPGFYFIDIQTDQVEEFERLVRDSPGLRELTRVPMLRGRITAINGQAPAQLDIPPEIAWVFRGDRGLTWSRTAPDPVRLSAGRWWPEDYRGPPLVSLDSAVGEGLGIGPGDRIAINLLGRDIEVEIANLRVIEWGHLGINFVMIFSPGLLESAPQTHIAAVKVDPAAEDALERAVTDRFANVSAIRVKEVLEAVGGLISDIAMALRATAAVALVSGVLVLAGAIAAGHHRRVYDAVVLKVLGATRRDISRAFLLEYGLLGLVTGAIAGLAGSLAAYLVLTEVMHMGFTLLPGTVIWTALIATAITLLFGFAGTWRALSQKAAPLLRNE